MDQRLNAAFSEMCLQLVSNAAFHDKKMIHVRGRLRGWGESRDYVVPNLGQIPCREGPSAIGELIQPLQALGEDGSLELVEAAVHTENGMMIAHALSVIPHLAGALGQF